MAKLIPPPVMGAPRATYAHLVKPTPPAKKRTIVAKSGKFDAVSNGCYAEAPAKDYSKS